MDNAWVTARANERCMRKITTLDKQWQQLMELCASEAKFRSEGDHPRLLKLLAAEIDDLATHMGFSPQRIATRDFRAHREGDHIVGIITD
jgi:hypothetical protein